MAAVMSANVYHQHDVMYTLQVLGCYGIIVSRHFNWIYSYRVRN